MHKFIDSLNKERIRCEEAGDYKRANVCKERIYELRDITKKQQLCKLEKKHREQLKSIQEAKHSELEVLRQLWQQRLDEYDKRTQTLILSMKERHQNEYIEHLNEMKTKHLFKWQPSREYLEICKLEKILAKQMMYKEAEKEKKKAMKLKKYEYSVQFQKYNEKLVKLTNQLKQQQLQEIKVLSQRVNQGYNECEKLKQREMSGLHLRYRNIHSSLLATHKQQHQKYSS